MDLSKKHEKIEDIFQVDVVVHVWALDVTALITNTASHLGCTCAYVGDVK